MPYCPWLYRPLLRPLPWWSPTVSLILSIWLGLCSLSVVPDLLQVYHCFVVAAQVRLQHRLEEDKKGGAKTKRAKRKGTKQAPQQQWTPQQPPRPSPPPPSPATNDDDDDDDEHLRCYISMDLMRDPVVADDGHAYERKCIQGWFDKCIESTDAHWLGKLSHFLLIRTDRRGSPPACVLHVCQWAGRSPLR